MSELVLVANAADGTLSTLRLHRTGGTEGGAWLEPLALVGELPGCSTFAVDAGRDLVHAAYKDDDGAGLATLSLDREFDNGFRVGAYFTLTDVSFAEFGEGSFDKGIRLTIPFSWVLGQPTQSDYSATIRPLTRDGGAPLNVSGRLYETIRPWQEQRLDMQWGKAWR